MKRFLTPFVLIAALTLAASAPASPQHGTTVKLARTSLGKILVDGAGFTLYVFTSDRRNKDVCIAMRSCRSVWPPLTTHHKPTAGNGVKAALLSSIAIPHGRQVTYAGHPLYTYSGDTGPGQTDYVGTPEFGGTWYAESGAGHMVR